MTTKAKPTVRLLKVIVHPVFVVDDGDDLHELAADPVVVSAKQWPNYPAAGFAEAFDGLKDQIVNAAERNDADANDPGPTGPAINEEARSAAAAKPNRAQRRAAPKGKSSTPVES